MDRTYGVEVKIPGALPTLVTSFDLRMLHLAGSRNVNAK
jgi:hypothetical protein